MSQPITVLIPCKNELENISACIASARLIGNEVLVADSGSTDGTLELAKKHADRVIERDYIDSGDFKNWAIPQARHQWVLILDADERITKNLATEIRQVLAATGDQQAYEIARRNFFLGYPIDHGDWSRDKVTRLFLRDECRYRLYTDHSEIEVPEDRLGTLHERMNHYTAWQLAPYLAKMQHYAEQQASLWHDTGKKPKLRHLALNAPMRFLRSYLLNGGFRDGMIGFLMASLTAYYSFLKQFLFWQKCYGRSIAEFDAEFVDRHPTQAARRVFADDGNNAGSRSAA